MLRRIGRARAALAIAGIGILVAAVVALRLPDANHGAIINGRGDSNLDLASINLDQFRQSNAAGESQVFYVSGSVDGLYPGNSADLNLSVRNPLGTAIVVQSISIYAGSPTPACPSSNLVVTSSNWPLNTTYTISNLSLRVPANSGPVPGPSVPLGLVANAPDACKGIAFPLQYGGTAVQG